MTNSPSKVGDAPTRLQDYPVTNALFSNELFVICLIMLIIIIVIEVN